MLLYVLALSDFINFALKRDTSRATSPRPEWTTNCSSPQKKSEILTFRTYPSRPKNTKKGSKIQLYGTQLLRSRRGIFNLSTTSFHFFDEKIKFFIDNPRFFSLF